MYSNLNEPASYVPKCFISGDIEMMMSHSGKHLTVLEGVARGPAPHWPDKHWTRDYWVIEEAGHQQILTCLQTSPWHSLLGALHVTMKTTLLLFCSLLCVATSQIDQDGGKEIYSTLSVSQSLHNVCKTVLWGRRLRLIEPSFLWFWQCALSHSQWWAMQRCPRSTGSPTTPMAAPCPSRVY